MSAYNYSLQSSLFGSVEPVEKEISPERYRAIQDKYIRLTVLECVLQAFILDLCNLWRFMDDPHVIFNTTDMRCWIASKRYSITDNSNRQPWFDLAMEDLSMLDDVLARRSTNIATMTDHYHQYKRV